MQSLADTRRNDGSEMITNDDRLPVSLDDLSLDMRNIESLLSGDASEIQAQMNAALLSASVSGDLDIICQLLDLGADPDCSDDDSNTPLIHAVTNRRQAAAARLIAAGCDVNAVNRTHRTALHLTCWHGDRRCVALLLSAGADPTYHEPFGDSLIMITAAAGHTAILAKLLKTRLCDVGERNGEDNTALHFACQVEDSGCTRLLVKNGADLEARNAWGFTPLNIAVSRNHNEVARVLIDAGCKVNTSCASARTPLHFASRRNNIKLVRYLLDHGAFVDARDSNQNTPLIESVYHNHVDVVRLLMQYNCDIRTIGRAMIRGECSRCLPLDVALERGNFEIAKMLLLAGCEKESLHPELISDLTFKLKHDQSLLRWFHGKLCSPNTLSQQCRFVIRECLGYDAPQSVRKLPLPTRIIDYLNLADL